MSQLFSRNSLPDLTKTLGQALASDRASGEVSQVPEELAREQILALFLGTPESPPFPVVADGISADYRAARDAVISCIQKTPKEPAPLFPTLYSVIAENSLSLGGVAFSAVALPRIAYNFPGTLDTVVSTLNEFQSSWDSTLDSCTSYLERQLVRSQIASLSLGALGVRARLDDTRPVFHIANAGGWMNDPNGLKWYTTSDGERRLIIGAQTNPYGSGEHWGSIHWSRGELSDTTGLFEQQGIWLPPAEELGYTDCFSGTLVPIPIPHPTDPTQSVFGVMFTAVGNAPNGFLGSPRTALALYSDEALTKPIEAPYFITDVELYRDAYDGVSRERIENRFDVRDPYAFVRNDKLFMLLAATELPGRVGKGVVALLTPSNPDKPHLPWKYVGDTFRHERSSIEDGGPGIIECANLISLGEKDVLIFSSQRKASDGPLRGHHHHEAVEYRIGKFDPANGKFTPDSLLDDSEILPVVNYGRGFYAPTTTPHYDGEGVTMVGWGRVSGNRGCGWAGCATVPQRLTLRDNDLFVEPEHSVTLLRGDKILSQHSVSNSKVISPEFQSRTFDMELTLSCRSPENPAVVKLLCDERGEFGVPIVFDKSNLWIGDERIPVRNPSRKTLAVRILVDNRVIEVFTEEGRTLFAAVDD
ncbi:MAG: GH32 C-terminal domain-containing protein, partial [Bdellovibrionales bacterium]|nr:GH32 C-terminal domain-containing protein [Bdellovibrionales bacterium]